MNKITYLIEMIRKHAKIIREDLSLEVNRDFGQKVGLVAEESGMQKGVLIQSTEVSLNMLRSNFV